jgi:hypothetical protein
MVISARRRGAVLILVVMMLAAPVVTACSGRSPARHAPAASSFLPAPAPSPVLFSGPLPAYRPASP